MENNPAIRPGRPWLFAALLLAMTFLAYQPVWRAGFIWDDDEFLTAHPTVKTLNLDSADCLRQLWFTAASLDYYPMTYTLWWAERKMWGNHPLGYHLVNVLLHAVSSILWWRVFVRLRLPGAWLAAAIFALHPVNVESVAWISETKNTLAMFFYAATALTWLKYEDEGKARWYALSLALFALALFSKTAVAPLPLILLGLALWRRGKMEWTDARRVAPFLALSIVLGLVTVWFHHHRAIGGDVVRTDDFFSRLAGAGWAVWFYLSKALLPTGLSFVYPRWEINSRNVLSYVPLVLVAAAFVLFWRFRRSWGKAALFTLGYFVLMLLPVLGFLSVYFMRYSLVADHWQYFAVLGPIVLAAGIIRSPLAGAVVVLVLCCLTWNQCLIYKNSEILWQTTYLRNPESTIARNNLSGEFLLEGRVDEAIHLCQSVLAEHPADFVARCNLAYSYMQKGRVDDAIKQYKKAEDLQPANAGVAYNLSLALVKAGRTDEVIPAFQRAIELQPDNADAWCNLGYYDLRAGRRPQALDAYEKAVELDPDLALAHNDLGSILLGLGRTNEALSHFKRASQLMPDFAEARYNVAGVDERAGRVAEAISNYGAALKIQPDFEAALNNLAWLLAAGPDHSLRDGAQALQLAEKAAERTKGKNAGVLRTLAAALAQTGRLDEAVKTIDKALSIASNNAPLSAELKKEQAQYRAGKGN